MAEIAVATHLTVVLATGLWVLKDRQIFPWLLLQDVTRFNPASGATPPWLFTLKDGKLPRST
jgi:hypothetical protein